MYKLGDRVVLVKDVPSINVPKHSVGTVVCVGHDTERYPLIVRFDSTLKTGAIALEEISLYKDGLVRAAEKIK